MNASLFPRLAPWAKFFRPFQGLDTGLQPVFNFLQVNDASRAS
ncbi:MAG TPA: hypothetical protein VGC66_02400 [Pyrinomonadaceae bacterium]